MRDEGTGVDFIIFGLLVVFILALLKCNAQPRGRLFAP